MYGRLTTKISIGKTRINLCLENQVSNTGRDFKLIGSRKNLQHPPKWMDRLELHHYIHTFKYIDEQGGYFEIELDYNDKFVSLTKLNK